MAEYDLGPYRVRPRGEFNSTTIYRYLDLVTCNGSSFICTNLDTIDHDSCIGVHPTGGETPTEESIERGKLYWQCVGSKGDTGRDGDQYLEFKTIVNGRWDFSETDKIKIPDEGLDTIEIINVENGCCGIILTTKELELPYNSDYSIDFYYVTRTTGQYYMYTFVYGSCISDNNRFIWNRTVISQDDQFH